LVPNLIAHIFLENKENRQNPQRPQVVARTPANALIMIVDEEVGMTI
jgi:hypothetical protein